MMNTTVVHQRSSVTEGKLVSAVAHKDSYKEDGAREFLKNFSTQRRHSLPSLKISTMPFLSYDHGLGEEEEKRLEYIRELCSLSLKSSSTIGNPISADEEGRPQNNQLTINKILDEACSVTQEYVADSDKRDEWDSDDTGVFVVVPIKEDNYVNKRSMMSRKNRRRNELLLDDASGITDALLALKEEKEDKDPLLLECSDDEESSCSDEESLEDFDFHF